MRNNKIINIKTTTDKNDCSNKEYVDTEIKNVITKDNFQTYKEDVKRSHKDFITMDNFQTYKEDVKRSQKDFITKTFVDDAIKLAKKEVYNSIFNKFKHLNIF